MSSKDEHNDDNDAQGNHRHRYGAENGKKPDQGSAKGGRARQDGDKPPYKVGYGRPPEESRIVKGEVRNPRGRPMGSKNKPKMASNRFVR